MQKGSLVFVIILGIIAVTIAVYAINQNHMGTIDEDKIIENQPELNIIDQNKSETTNTPITEEEINKKLNEIEQVAKNNTYTPQPREWITSGPFQIDRSKYILGEKIFVKVNQVPASESGQIIFLRPLNSTHYSVYISMPFDGVSKNSFNVYFEPKLSKKDNICSKDDLLGKWAVVFRGTNYPNLYFELKDQILPGSEDDYKPVC